MVGIERRFSEPDWSFDKMKEMFIIPILDSFEDIRIHEEVLRELYPLSRSLVDSRLGINCRS